MAEENTERNIKTLSRAVVSFIKTLGKESGGKLVIPLSALDEVTSDRVRRSAAELTKMFADLLNERQPNADGVYTIPAGVLFQRFGRSATSSGYWNQPGSAAARVAHAAGYVVSSSSSVIEDEASPAFGAVMTRFSFTPATVQPEKHAAMADAIAKWQTEKAEKANAEEEEEASEE
jgi:hypothetical protein